MANPSAFTAHEYEENIVRTVPFLDTMIRQVLDLVRCAATAPLQWLDVGCGTGELARRAAAQFPQASFTLWDADADMLELARIKCRGIDAAIRHGDIRQGEFGRQRYSVATALLVLHSLPHGDRLGVLRGIHGSMTEGGLFICVDHTAPTSDEGAQLALRRWRDFQIEQGKSHAEADAHIRRYGVQYSPQPLGQQMDDLRAAGFRTVELFWFSYLQAGLYAVK